MLEAIDEFVRNHMYLYYGFMAIPVLVSLYKVRHLLRYDHEMYPERYSEEELLELRKRHKRYFWNFWILN